MCISLIYAGEARVQLIIRLENHDISRRSLERVDHAFHSMVFSAE
jgi:hypothetical protein